MPSPSAIITQGYGSWGSTSDVITLGYGAAEVVIPLDPETEVPAARSWRMTAHPGRTFAVEEHAGRTWTMTEHPGRTFTVASHPGRTWRMTKHPGRTWSR